MSKSDSYQTTVYPPVAYATAVNDFTASAPYEEEEKSSYSNSSSSGVYLVDLPVGVANIGIEFQRSPPVITDIDRTIMYPIPTTTTTTTNNHQQQQLSIGHYCHGIILPGVEIVNILDVTQLQQLIQQNVANPRRLICSNSAFYVDAATVAAAAAASTTTTTGGGKPPPPPPPGVLYKHTLPHDDVSSSSSPPLPDLGFTMFGFPPVISQVQPHSAMDGLLHPYQTVEALLVPGQPIFNLQSGAFTSAKVHERLASTSNIQGRQLVVKDAPLRPREKGSNAAFDFKAFTNSSSWSLNRMLGVKKKKKK